MAIIVLQHTESETPGRLGITLRDHGVQLDIRRLDLPVGGPNFNRHVPPDFDDVEGVISLGGDMMVGDPLPWMQDELDFLAEAHKRKLPLVGVCLGAQMIAKAIGGEVGPMESGAEWGMTVVDQTTHGNTEVMLSGVPWRHRQFSAHGHEIKKLPAGTTTLQFSARCKVQAFKAGLRTYGFQYHLECDLPKIEEMLTSGDPQIAQAGLSVEQGIADARAHYAEYARVSDRLCVNMASYLFPVTRAILA